MALLSSILQHKPDEWRDHSYADQTYVKVQVSQSSSEYRRVSKEFQKTFTNSQVTEVIRIQHPFAFGRYQLRKEQLAKSHGEPRQSTKYLRISNINKLNEILEYNCDSRRGGFNFPNVVGEGGHFLVVKMLGSNFDERDTHRYPEYLIKCTPTSTSRYYDNEFEDQFGRLGVF